MKIASTRKISVAPHENWGLHLIILILLASPLTLGCKRPSSSSVAPMPYGHDFDDKRLALGLPIVPSGWLVQGDDREIQWVNPAHNDRAKASQPKHAYKKIGLSARGTIEYEFDLYYNGKEYIDREGHHDYEYIQILFHFDRLYAGEAAESCWDYSASLSSGIELLTPEEADSLLKAWGIAR